MAKLVYLMIGSLDGYMEDERGKFDWAQPDEHVHSFINDLARPIGTFLYGRRMYETMVVWDDDQMIAGHPPHIRDFAQIWRIADKVVYSTTLESASTAKTRIEPAFDPEVVRQMKAEAASDIAIGGPDLAAQAIRAGLVDEYQLFLAPVVVGGGKRALPEDIRIDLELVDERRFESGVVFLHLRPRA